MFRFVGIAASLASIWLGIYFLRLARTDPSKWPSTSGTVIGSSVSSTSSSTRRGAMRRYHLRLRYEYQVAGQRFEGTKASLQNSSVATSALTLDLERIRREKYPAGTQLKVFYDPANPKSAVLDPAPQRTEGFLIGTFLIFLGAAGTIVCPFGKLGRLR